MNGKQAIIQKIQDEADAHAQAILSEANAYFDDVKARADEAAKAAEAEGMKKAAAEAAGLKDNRRVLAELDARKQSLGFIQSAVDKAYSLAAERLLALSDDKYAEFFSRIVLENAEDGDEVKIAKADAGRLTVAWIDKIAKKSGKKLSLSKVHHDSRGGVILCGKMYDKNLTIEELFAESRTRTEASVIDILFKES